MADFEFRGSSQRNSQRMLPCPLHNLGSAIWDLESAIWDLPSRIASDAGLAIRLSPSGDDPRDDVNFAPSEARPHDGRRRLERSPPDTDEPGPRAGRPPGAARRGDRRVFDRGDELLHGG